MIKQCRECGERIVGRSDKVYCSDSCRNSYNNERNKDRNQLIRNTHNRLRRNYRILNGLCSGKQPAIFSMSFLRELGFDLYSATAVYLMDNGEHGKLLYDIAYFIIPPDQVKVIKNLKESTPSYGTAYFQL